MTQAVRILCEAMADQQRRDDPARIWHHPVLVREVIELLQPVPGTTFVDCTIGTGGHSLAILPRLLAAQGHQRSGRLIAIDRDAAALSQAAQRLTEFQSQVEYVQDSFSRLPEILARCGLAQVHGLVADLGMSSLQVEDPARGFSFRHEGPLDMRMDQRAAITAEELIRTWSEEELAALLHDVGEERWARRIARRIVEARAQEAITTTTQLARVVAEAVPGRAGSGRRPSRHDPRWRPSRKDHSRRGSVGSRWAADRGSAARGGARGLHPATRTFMALRIAVNEELDALAQLLKVLPEVLVPGGRAAIITFHSLEDRMVKQAFARAAREGIFRLLSKKPLRASDREVGVNPRSRSAKLRAVERLG